MKKPTSREPIGSAAYTRVSKFAGFIEAARRKAFVILDGTLLHIDRVGMAGGRDRPYYSGKHKCHGVNVQVIADPAGRLIWASPALPGGAASRSPPPQASSSNCDAAM